MSATVERPTAAVQPRPRPALQRAEGLELLGEVSGSGYKQGAALVRRADGQMVQLGPLMYALLDAIDGRRDTPALAEAMTARLGRRVEREHVAPLAGKLAQQGLLAGHEDQAPPRMNPLLALRWKFLITDSAVTRRITAPFLWLFRPWALLPALAGFAVVCWFVLIHKGVASATAQAFRDPELLLLILGLAVASAAFHEIGHASACRYGGGRPGGMGGGIYLVWPAFYTDVTDAYRLPRRARLRTDLGGLYFNAIVAVVTLGVWLAVRADALLLLIALQLLEMVKQLSPVIRADGYHVLSDATGVPDLYAHIGPTLRRLRPGRREPSALTGRARALVTVWVLVIVPVLLSMMLSAILLLPKLAASTWESGSHIASLVPDQVGSGDVLSLLASAVRLFALALPVVGTVLMATRLVRSGVGKGRSWSAGEPRRRALLAAGTVGLVGLLAWAWWPSGQYQPVRSTDDGTLFGVPQLVASRAAAAPAQADVPVHLAPGKHMAVALIPIGGATKEHPAIFVVKARGGQSAIVVSDRTPSVRGVPTAGAVQHQSGTRGAGTATAPAGSTATTATGAAAPPGATSSTAAAPAQGAASSTTGAPVEAAAFPFKLPDKPGPHDSQALATNAQDGGVRYAVVYSVVTVKPGETVDETNSAYALASCKACTTVAVSFQLVLVVGQTQTIKPINIAEALNVNCPSCVTTAIADQIVVTVRSLPSEELLRRLTEELSRLNAIPQLGAGGSPDAVAGQVLAVQRDIQKDLADSGLVDDPASSSTNPGAGTTTSTPRNSGSTTDNTSTTTATGPESTPPAAATTSTPTTGTSTTPTTSTSSSTTTPSTETTTPTSSTPPATTTTTTGDTPSATDPAATTVPTTTTEGSGDGSAGTPAG